MARKSGTSGMRLSCAALGWGKIADEKQFSKILRSIKDAGYDGVGIEYEVIPDSLKKNPGQVKKLAKKAGLEVVSMALNETTPDMAVVAKKMGAESGWLCLLEKDSKTAQRVTNTLTKAFKDEGLKIAIHPHVRSNAENYKQLDEILRRAKPLSPGICFDSAHLEALRVDLPDFIKRYSDRIVLAHLKDLRARVSPDKIDYDKDFVDLGEGVVDFKAVIKALKSIGYRGWLMVEVDFPHKESMDESVAKNYQYLKSLL
jgi:sugar phosphate isomerase/epimerase